MKCEKCGQESRTLKFLGERSGWCPPCFYRVEAPTGQSAMIATDEIPGGIQIRHGICNEDGTPRTYYSKSAIERAAYDVGFFVGDNTPKPNPRIVEERAREREARKRQGTL
jgi:hypothetical protein